MAILGIKEVVRRINEEGLITNLGGRDLSNPEGTGVDLRLGALHVLTSGGAYIEADGESGLGKRKGVETVEVSRYTEGAPSEAVIEPGKYYLVQTIESVKTPLDLMVMVYPRTSLFRAGLILVASKGDPGYEGPLTFGLKNESEFPVTLQMGARFCNIVFNTIEGEAIAYRGQHQGGRISFGEEEQV